MLKRRNLKNPFFITNFVAFGFVFGFKLFQLYLEHITLIRPYDYIFIAWLFVASSCILALLDITKINNLFMAYVKLFPIYFAIVLFYELFLDWM